MKNRDDTTRSSKSSPLHPLSILLVDDTPANQKAIAGILQKQGHSVVVATSGREAVARMKDQGELFQVVLMDVQMPDMDGYAATAEIRKSNDADTRSIPIIGMTAQGDRERCLEAGMDDYIAKPINVNALIELVESISGPGIFAKQRVVVSACHGNAARAPDGHSILNLQAALQRLGGDTELLDNFVEVYHEDAPGLLDAIRQAIDRGDGPTLHRAAHSLKGLAANFDAEQVVAAAGRLERMGESGALDEAENARVELELAVERFNEALARSDLVQPRPRRENNRPS